MPGQPGPCRKLELTLDIVSSEKKHTIGVIPIATGAPCLLKIVLKRAGNIAVHNQPDIRLVDPHPERIGRRDHP